MSARTFLTILAFFLTSAAFPEAQTSKTLTNDDVIEMVKNGMPESVVLNAVRTNKGHFDMSASELVRLHKAGVTENELNAMMAPPSSSAAAAPAPAATNASDSNNAKSRMPKAYLVVGTDQKELPLEKTQLAETKTKPSNMHNLAGDSALAQAMQGGINAATWDTATHMNSIVGGQMVQGAGSIFAGSMGHRTPTVTYVWGVPNPASGNLVKTTKPGFTVDFSRAFGVNPEEYAPAIVKLTSAQNTCRIVGATEGKADARSTPAANWQMYSHFLEESVTTNPQKLAPGKYKIAITSELSPGEYGIVLRPVSKTKTFSGGDVARAQGDGLMFDAIWSFQISEEAQ